MLHVPVRVPEVAVARWLRQPANDDPGGTPSIGAMLQRATGHQVVAEGSITPSISRSGNMNRAADASGRAAFASYAATCAGASITIVTPRTAAEVERHRVVTSTSSCCRLRGASGSRPVLFLPGSLASVRRLRPAILEQEAVRQLAPGDAEHQGQILASGSRRIPRNSRPLRRPCRHGRRYRQRRRQNHDDRRQALPNLHAHLPLQPVVEPPRRTESGDAPA